MKFSYENQGASTYLVYEIEDNDSVDTLSLGMLTNNNIPGIAKALFTQMDNSRFIKYNVSSKISMQQYFSGIVNRKRLLGVFGSIVEGLSAAEDYMLDLNSIVFAPDYIFIDVSNCSALMICVPICDESGHKNDLCAFFKNIMVNTKFDQTENSDHVAKIFNYLNSCVELSLADFKKLIDELRNEQIGISVQPISSPSANAQPVYRQPAQQIVHSANTIQYNSPSTQQPSVQNMPPQANNYRSPAPIPVNSMQRPVSAVPQNNGMPMRQPSVPNTAIPQQIQPQAPNVNGEKKMSMFNLLMHYNKENKEIYNQQKAARKSQKMAAKQNPQKPGAPAQPVSAMPVANFNIPGTTMNSNGKSPAFAVPGAQNNAVSPSFAKADKQVSGASLNSPSGFPKTSVASQQYNPVGIQAKTAVGNNSQNNNFAPGAHQMPPQNVIPMQSPVSAPSQNAIPMQSPVSAPPQNANPMQSPVSASPQNVNPMQTFTANAAAAQQSQHLNFGDTTVLSGGKPGETTVLNGGAQVRQTLIPHLIRVKSGEKIYINKPFFRIGKEKSYVDYFIGDNTAVSRSHANIVTDNDKFIIVDTNSTNHTFVNGTMIRSNVDTPIHHGDKIRLGNEEFEFRLY